MAAVAIAMDESVDSDDDGLPDAWEQQYFGDPTSTDPADDPDNDRLTNLGEAVQHTNPLNPDTHGDHIYDGGGYMDLRFHAIEPTEAGICLLLGYPDVIHRYARPLRLHGSAPGQLEPPPNH